MICGELFVGFSFHITMSKATETKREGGFAEVICVCELCERDITQWAVGNAGLMRWSVEVGETKKKDQTRSNKWEACNI